MKKLAATVTTIRVQRRTAPQLDGTLTVEEEIESTRNHVLLSFSAADVQSMDMASLLGWQLALQHGNEFGRWKTPRKWHPLAAKYLLDIDLRARLMNYLPEHQQKLVLEMDAERASAESGDVDLVPAFGTPAHRLLARAVESLQRLLVLCRVGPAGTGKRGKGRPLDPSTLAGLAYAGLPQLLAAGLARRLASLPDHGLPDGPGLFASVKAEDFDRFRPNVSANLKAQVNRLLMLSDLGMWADVALLDGPRTLTTGVAGEAEVSEPEEFVDTHLPLPDDYVAEMGRHIHWLIEELGPAVLSVAEDVRKLWQATDNPGRTPGAVAQRRDDGISRLLAAAQWSDCSGRPIERFPFGPGFGKTHANRWKPTHYGDFIYLLRLVQMAHFFVVGLSMGARKSELTTLQRSCVEYSTNGMPYATGRTWKLIERHDGEVRDWVLPDFAMHAVEQQLRLVAVVDGIGPRVPQRLSRPSVSPQHLWAEIGISNSDNTKQLLHTSRALRWFSAALGMAEEPGGQGLRVHRFRKTLARLAALAMTQAPKILKDVFGHKSIEMTLYYILADKGLQADVERVTRELRVMKATAAVEAIVAAEDGVDSAYGGFGGPAAPKLAGAVGVHRAGLHKRGEEWGADTARELAEILTLRGKAWQMVRPGIFCTKFPGTESGPCNKSKGAPEPARCQSHCQHRLEEPFLRADVQASLSECVAAYVESREQERDLVQAFWADQVRVHLGRFADVEASWSKDPAVQEIIEAARFSEATS